MKQKLLLLALAFIGCTAAKANTNGDEPGDGKKQDVAGYVFHSDSKKPMKDVSVTAYNISKKEKVVLTDDDGSFSFDELKPGTYKFVFEKSGYRKMIREKVVIRTDETFQLNIEMIEANDLEILPSPVHFGM
ncbi:MAG: carboxypeptidase regulatory-like domain-containing protein [Chitinophagaceae bacterium]|nr:carboxypeptidase regulatory-like domain-containing protein [Chitinophagaceae bacterium]